MLDFGAEFIGVHKLNRVFTLNFVNSALKFEELVEGDLFTLLYLFVRRDAD